MNDVDDSSPRLKVSEISVYFQVNSSADLYEAPIED